MLGLERSADAVSARRRAEGGYWPPPERSNDPSVGHRVEPITFQQQPLPAPTKALSANSFWEVLR